MLVRIHIFVLILFSFPSFVFAQDPICFSEASEQTQSIVNKHYEKQNINARLAGVTLIKSSAIITNGKAFKTEDPQYENVWYTEYTIVGYMRIEGIPFRNYGFFVRLNSETCEVLKVALVQAGETTLMRFTPTYNDSAPSRNSGLTVLEGTASKIETPENGSPKLGYTFNLNGRESIQVLTDRRLKYEQEQMRKLTQD